MSDALPLPRRPNPAQYRKLAKELQDACRSGDADAVHAWATRWINDAGDIERVERRWHEFRESERADSCALNRIQFFIAREHGFASWQKFATALQELVSETSAVSTFEAAADAVVDGEISKLRLLLRECPELVFARSAREHRSTLLHYVSANGVEDFRQRTPANIVEIATFLLDSGADVNAHSDAYGGRSDTLGLAATSMHPAHAGVQIPLLQVLLDRGATIRGTGMVRGCFDNGQPQAAEFLAEHGAPLDVESAAGLGRLDVLERCHEAGTLNEAALLYACGYGQRDAVEFLLDHGAPADARNDRGQTGLHWAAYGGEYEIVRLLLERGAPADIRDHGFQATPLELAIFVWAYSGVPAEREAAANCVQLLVRAGARLDPGVEHTDDRRRVAIEKALADPVLRAALR